MKYFENTNLQIPPVMLKDSEISQELDISASCKKSTAKKGQNFIEFVLVFPLIILFLFATVELAFFWRANVAVQKMANQIASNAANYTELDSAGTFQPLIDRITFLLDETNNPNPIHIPVSRGLVFSTLAPSDGAAPYAIYTSNGAKDGVQSMIVQINMKNPEEAGIEAQVTYNYETVLLRAQYVLPNGTMVTVIPSTVEIKSSVVKQYAYY